MTTYNVESWLRHKNVYYKKGDTIASELLTKKQQAQLIQQGVISRVADHTDLNNSSDNEYENNGEGDEQKDIDEPIEKTLELNFEYDELKAGAKEQGLEFKGNISRADLIDLIVKSNKQDYFLDQLED